MSSYVSTPIDSEAILEDIRSLVMIESPTKHVAGVNGVLEVVAGWFTGTGATLERIRIDEGLGDVLRVRCDPEDTRPGILVLSHCDTVHPVGTLEKELPFRREGDKVYGPGVYDMKGGLVLAVAAYRRLAKAGRRRPLPLTFMFTPDEEAGSMVSRPHIENEALCNRYVLVTEAIRNRCQVITQRKGLGRFVIRARGRPAHSGVNHDQGRSAIRAIAELIPKIEGLTDYSRGITTSVGLISGGTNVNVIPEHCIANADLRVCDLAAAAELTAKFQALASPGPDVVITVTGGIHRPPFVHDAKVDELLGKAKAVGAAFGFQIERAAVTGGGSDGNLTAAKGVATLDGLGVDGAGAHTHNEHLQFASIEPGTRLMEGLFETLS